MSDGKPFKHAALAARLAAEKAAKAMAVLALHRKGKPLPNPKKNKTEQPR